LLGFMLLGECDLCWWLQTDRCVLRGWTESQGQSRANCQSYH